MSGLKTSIINEIKKILRDSYHSGALGYYHDHSEKKAQRSKVG